MHDRYDDNSATSLAVQELARIMLGDGNRNVALGRACEATKALIPGADEGPSPFCKTRRARWPRLGTSRRARTRRNADSAWVPASTLLRPAGQRG